MNAKEPEVTVIIPCRNEAGTLAACIDALEWQDMQAFEVLLVDGGSTDGCREMAHRRGVRILHDPGEGPAAARNLGIEEARAPIIAFTDADCVPERDWLSQILRVFEERPTLAGFGGALRMPRRTRIGRMEDDDAVACYRGVITSNVAYRRDALLAVGGFDPALKCAEDYDLSWRLRDAGFEVGYDPRPIVMHDPPEVNGDLATYLRKQAWYARNDIPAHARAIARYRQAPERAWGSRDAVGGVRGALVPAALVAATAAGALFLQPWIAGVSLATVGARATRHVATTSRGGKFLPRVAIATAKEMARGVGTLHGLADLVAARGRALSPRALEPLAPSLRARAPLLA